MLFKSSSISAHRPRPAHIASIPTALCVALLIATYSLPANAKVMQAPGSRVSIDLSDSFKSAAMFAGFIEILSSAAVVVRELPSEDYESVAAGFSAKALAKKGLTDVKTLKLQRLDQHLSLTAIQKHTRAVYERFILVFKNTNNTAIVTFNVPQSAFAEGQIKRAHILKALASAKLEPKAAPSRDLFKLGYTGPYSLVGAPTGTSRTYTEKGDKSPKATRNIIVIAPSLNRLPVKNIHEFSQYAIRQLKTIRIIKTEGTKDLQIAGISGHEIKVAAMRSPSKTPVIVQQLMLAPKTGGYYRLLAITKQADAHRLVPEIDKMFASFKATEVLSAQ
jgi:hypothetical protein